MSTQTTDLRALAAACDMAVLRALELVGKRVARDGRARFGAMQKSDIPWSEVHTVWDAEPHHVEAALSGAWTVLPRMVSQHGCCALVEPALAALLDTYVRELLSARRPHDFADLEARLAGAVQGRG